VRDFTYVGDIVAANQAAAIADVAPGEVCNVAGGGEALLSDVIDLVGQIAGTPVAIDQQPASAGDVTRTGGSIDRAAALLGWAPEVSLREGLAAQVAWHQAEPTAEGPGTTAP
jgi:nucleoside-diphosphate-sugar epimerase